MAVGLGIHFGAGMARSVIRAGGGAAIAGINKGISRIAKDPVLRNTAARAVAPNLRVAKAGLKGMIHPMNLYGGLVGSLIGGLGASMIGSAFRRRKTVKPQARSSV